MRGFFLNFCWMTVPGQENAARVNSGGGAPDLILPSRTALCLGAIHKRSSVPTLIPVLYSLRFCMFASTGDMDHITLSGFDPLN